MNMHTMRALPNEKGWSVGYWIEQTFVQMVPISPNGQICEEQRHKKTVWEEICQFSEEPDALNRVNQLNGGPGVKVTPSDHPMRSIR